MGCTTCGGTVGIPAQVLPTPRMEVPGAAGGLVLVEWQGDVPLVVQTAERQYLFTADRRRLYMTAADAAEAARHLDGVIVGVVDEVMTSA